MATLHKASVEVSDIVQQYGKAYEHQYWPGIDQRRVLKAIGQCRTSALGGHIDQCGSCGKIRVSYNSCRNRHCPKCQGTNRERWIEQRESELLPINYYHVVFTLPEELNRYCMLDPVYFYNRLFTCSRDTLMTLACDVKHLGAKPGMVAILHTWGQTLSLHPHVHLIVTGGGETETGHWRQARSKGKYLFPEKVMSQVFRGKFMEAWLNWHQQKRLSPDQATRTALYSKQWVVYCKLPFGGPQGVIEYLGRYTHKVAISNQRLIKVDEQGVRFRYKDYRDGAKNKEMQLSGVEFLRRFCLHILPSGFRRIRHYGLLASRNKPRLRYRQVLMGVASKPKANRDWKEVARQRMGYDADQCPCCKTGKMIRIQSFSANAPPKLAKTQPAPKT